MTHAKPAPQKGVHGVFRTRSEREIMRLVDRAWIRAQGLQISPSVHHSGNLNYVVPFGGEVVGHLGGIKGAQTGHPLLRALLIAIEKGTIRDVATAFPS